MTDFNDARPDPQGFGDRCICNCQPFPCRDSSSRLGKGNSGRSAGHRVVRGPTPRYMTSAGKAYETRHLVQDGVEEIDLMPNVGFLVSGMDQEYSEDIRGVVRAAGSVPV
jgi:hypothetical protein